MCGVVRALSSTVSSTRACRRWLCATTFEASRGAWTPGCCRSAFLRTDAAWTTRARSRRGQSFPRKGPSTRTKTWWMGTGSTARARCSARPSGHSKQGSLASWCGSAAKIRSTQTSLCWALSRQRPAHAANDAGLRCAWHVQACGRERARGPPPSVYPRPTHDSNNKLTGAP